MDGGGSRVAGEVLRYIWVSAYNENSDHVGE